MYSADDLTMLLTRTGGALHTVDGEELFCRLKSLVVSPDEYARVMVERQELVHLTGATFPRAAHHNTEVDGVVWRIVGVRRKLSGLTAWTMERETA